jgi:hypothetical protein
MDNAKRKKIIDDCMYSLIWNIPGALDWEPELQQKVRDAVTNVYDAGLQEGFNTTN